MIYGIIQKKSRNIMHGKIINYHPEKGYGFIYAEEYDDNIFVHKSEIKNASELFQGQSVKFQLKQTKKGLSAVSVVAGAKQHSPYFIFGVISAIITIGIFAYLYKYEPIKPILSYLIAINITTFLLYGYDKLISSGEALRIPEWNLHALAILGGSPAGLASQKFFRHKTVKGSFQLVYWLIVVVQVGLLYWLK